MSVKNTLLIEGCGGPVLSSVTKVGSVVLLEGQRLGSLPVLREALMQVVAADEHSFFQLAADSYLQCSLDVV